MHEKSVISPCPGNESTPDLAKAQRAQREPMQRENEVAMAIVDAAYQVHRTLGPGLLESAYEAIMVHELRKRGT